jgi:S1-C subfamily serine protease
MDSLFSTPEPDEATVTPEAVVATAPQPQPQRLWRVALLSGVVGALLVAVALGGFITGRGDVEPVVRAPVGQGGGSSSLLPSGTTPGGSAVSAKDSRVATKVDAGLVDINTDLSYEQAQAAGTGMVLTKDGIVLTNNHVIAGATNISVTDLGNGTTYQAKVLGYDMKLDVAVLQLQGASGLATVRTAKSGAHVGEKVLGIGNAGGSGGTPQVASGKITGTQQNVTVAGGPTGSENLRSMLETDANIVPGDSGGPLVSLSGKVLGMDTAGSQGIFITNGVQQPTQAFSIPIATALSVVKKVKSGDGGSGVHLGKTAFLGVEVAATPSASAFFGEAPTTATPGVAIGAVVPGTPAGKDLKAGDIITAVNGSAVTSPAQLTEALVGLSPKTTISLSYTTPDGSQKVTSVTLAAGPPQ